ncbi:MAG: glycosyltransferase family 2 protein [Thermosphaera sp.]
MNIYDVIGFIGVFIVFVPQTLFFLSHAFFYALSRKYKSAQEYIGEVYNRTVSFITPVRNEPLEYVEGLIDYVSKLGLPNYEIIIVSDDEEETKNKLLEKVSNWRNMGYNVWFVWRAKPIGYKSGALNVGLYASKGDFVFPLDVDCRPEKCLIGKGIGIMLKDPSVAGVVGRWEPIDITERLAQAVGLAMKTMVEILFKGRSVLGLSVFPLGTGTVFNSEILKKEVKGWDPARIQDDMEIGCRLMSRRFRIMYLDGCKAYVEVPNTYKGLRIQQARWAYGATDVFISRFKEIVKSPQRVIGKIEASMFLLQYLPAMLAFLGTGMLALISILSGIEYLGRHYYILILWLTAESVYAAILYHEIRDIVRNSWKTIVNLGRNAAIVTALTPHLSWSMIQAFARVKITYKRTPKGRFEYLAFTRRVPTEFLTGLLFLALSIILFAKELTLTGIWVLMQSLGFLYVTFRWPNDVFRK